MEKSETLFSENYDEMYAELDEVSKNELLKVEIDNELEEAIKELNSLKDQYSQKDTASLLQLCKENVLDTITSQFGLASLFLSNQNGGNVTTTHNFEKGQVNGEWVIDARDQEKYFAMQVNKERKWQEVRKEAGYDDKIKKMHAEDKASGKISVTDEYTGKTISTKRADIDHVVSAKEIESSVKNNLFMSQDERAKMATEDYNLAYTKDKANRSKGAKKMEDWLDKERPDGRTNEEVFEIDRDLAMAKDKNARRQIDKTVTTAAAKKYTKELLSTGGKDAAKMAAFSALGVIMRDFAEGIMIEVRLTFEQKGKESFREILARFKDRLKMILENLKGKWKDILKGSFEAGITAFLSNIVVFVINLFFTTLKKIVSMIRAGFVSLCQAVKILANPPAGMPKEEVHYQAVKILTSGLIGVLSLGLSAVIEKGLQAIPGLQPLMMFPIPSFGKEQRTVSDVIAVTLSSLAGGLITTIVLYFMDKARAKAKHDRLQIQLIAQSGVVVECQIAKTWCTLDEAYGFFKDMVFSTKEMFNQVEEKLETSFQAVKVESESRDDVMAQLRARFNK